MYGLVSHDYYMAVLQAAVGAAYLRDPSGPYLSGNKIASAKALHKVPTCSFTLLKQLIGLCICRVCVQADRIAWEQADPLCGCTMLTCEFFSDNKIAFRAASRQASNASTAT